MLEEKINNFNRMYAINKQLLDTLRKIGFKIAVFSAKYDYPLPNDFSNLLGKAAELLEELSHPTVNNKSCNICNKLNPENAEYCCHCGSSMIISSLSPECDNESNTRKSDRTAIKVVSHLRVILG